MKTIGENKEESKKDAKINPAQDQEYLKKRLDECRSSQRFYLSRKINQLFKADAKNYLHKREKLNAEIQLSIDTRQFRLQQLPKPEYPDALPVAERREEIIKTIRENQVTIICGETGSGKTTQLPKMCLELGRGVDGIIGHTQPRRIAAKSVAERIADELNTELGAVVGYKVRFSDHSKADSYIKLMTDGILLAEIRNDRYLNQYDTLIIDEAHERSLNIDFLLGYLRWLLPRRKDLKVVITSATIDPESFSRHFNFTGKKSDNAPIINVSGRTFPVEIRYHPLIPDDKQDEPAKEEAKEKDMLQAVVDATDELMAESPGGILIFFSGEREIRLASEALRKHHKPSVEILPLFARLSGAEQSRIFHPSGARRIILSTNVAETSLTVPGIKYVIDTGLARISRYSWRSRVQRLPIEKISQASASQRSGRCGRTSSGIAIRLYAEDDYEARPAFTLPEIQRTNLAAVILQLISLNLGDVYDFPYLEKPDTGMIRDGYKLLFELGAVNKAKGADIKITQIGRELASFPTDPRLARMLLAAKEYGVFEEVLVIVSALSTQDVRERPLDKQQASDQKHSRFKDESSDFISLLKLWDYYHDKNGELSQGQLRKLCKREFLSYMRLREWNETYRQLLMSSKSNQSRPTAERSRSTPPHLLTKAKIKHSKKHPLNTKLKEVNEAEGEDKYLSSYNAIHQSLLTGLLSNIGFKEENNEFQGVNNRKFFVFPGSALHKKPPKWLMSAEIVDTSRLFARTVAKIQAEWVEDAAKHLLKHHYSEPRWEQKPAQVVADEKSTLYGMVVTPKKRVNFGPIDPVTSRQLFIRHALVYGEYKCDANFFTHNRDLIEEVENLEAKARRRDILVDEEILYDFYDQLIPNTIYNGPAFQKWRKGFESSHPGALKLTKEYLMQRDDSHVQNEYYPDHLSIADMVLPLHYNFEPGKKEDGLSVKIPAAALNQLSSNSFDYLVPGMLEEKITEFIRSLPKQVRKQFVPAPEYAKACLESINIARTENPTNTSTPVSLVNAIAEALRKITGHRIDEELLENYQFSEHMQMRFEVVDESGKLIKAGRDFNALKNTVPDKRAQAAKTSKVPSDSIERSNIVEWDFSTLPEVVIMDISGMKIKAWPALVDESDSVSVSLFGSPQKAQRQNGLLRLILLKYKTTQRVLLKQIPEAQKMCLYYASTGKCDELTHSIIENTFRLTFISEKLLTYKHGVGISKSQYLDHLNRSAKNLPTVLAELCQQLLTVLSLNRDIRKQLKGNIDFSLLETLNDVKDQLYALVYPGFLNELSLEELRQYPRYLKAIAKRLDRLTGDTHKDRALRLQVQSLWDEYKKALAKYGASTELNEFRWMLEEFRVSLFAQDLGTAYPVSEKRLAKRFNEIKGQLS